MRAEVNTFPLTNHCSKLDSPLLHPSLLLIVLTGRDVWTSRGDKVKDKPVPKRELQKARCLTVMQTHCLQNIGEGEQLPWVTMIWWECIAAG